MASDVNEKAAFEAPWLKEAVKTLLESPAAEGLRIGQGLKIVTVTAYHIESDSESARIEITYGLR